MLKMCGPWHVAEKRLAVMRVQDSATVAGQVEGNCPHQQRHRFEDVYPAMHHYMEVWELFNIGRVLGSL